MTVGTDGKEVCADNHKIRLNSHVPQNYFRQVLQIENSGLPTMESNMQYDWYTLWQLTS
jgi:hypothetical protein